MICKMVTITALFDCITADDIVENTCWYLFVYLVVYLIAEDDIVENTCLVGLVILPAAVFTIFWVCLLQLP